MKNSEQLIAIFATIKDPSRRERLTKIYEACYEEMCDRFINQVLEPAVMEELECVEEN